MKIAYFREKSLPDEWTRIHKKYPLTEFVEINPDFFDGQNMTVFVHFGRESLEDKHRKKFKELKIFKNFKLRYSLAIFGPTYPKGILGTTFNDYILKHPHDFRNADFVTIRNEGAHGKLMNPCETCDIFLEKWK